VFSSVMKTVVLVAQCSVQCGNGTQHRNVYCAVTDGNVINVRPAVDCYDQPRMAEKQDCVATDCSMVWFTGAYGRVCLLSLCCEFFSTGVSQ